MASRAKHGLSALQSAFPASKFSANAGDALNAVCVWSDCGETPTNGAGGSMRRPPGCVGNTRELHWGKKGRAPKESCWNFYAVCIEKDGILN
jgi:hypothetical protein